MIVSTPSLDKIAFLVHEPTLWTHYSNVWSKLDRGSFVIVLTNRFRPPRGRRPDLGVTEFRARVQAAGHETAWADELIRRGAKYRYLVSNHKMRGDSVQPAPARVRALYALDHAIKRGINRACTALGRPERFAFHGFAPKQYWPLQIGEIQIRFMYGADVGEGWSLAPWNGIYDAFHRRFIVLTELLGKLGKQGFEILEQVESKGLAVFGDEDPVVIRVLAAKR